MFHTLNLNGNLTGTDFYRGLESLTDSRKILDLPVSSFFYIDEPSFIDGSLCPGSSSLLHEHCPSMA